MNRAAVRKFFISLIKKRPRLAGILRYISYDLFPETTILLSYPIKPKPRWTLKSPHKRLFDIINKDRNTYQEHLKSFLDLTDYLVQIPEKEADDSSLVKPFWLNGWISGLDGIALYSFVAHNKPRVFLEIGSGNSTRFARQAIIDHNLKTKIISIDPSPRIEVSDICFESIKEPVENINIDTFSQLEENDILYIDGSHKIFMNSDVTALFLEIIPQLKPGVLVEIHDIFLPYDYPAEWAGHYDSEQYLLAAYILANWDRFDIVLPAYFISHDRELKESISPIWKRDRMKNVERSGSSFWIRMK